MNTILLQGIVGSVAYGLSGPLSDVDRLGTYAAPTAEFLGLHPPVAKAASVVTTNPDVTLHEVGKLAHLCLSCNPTATELLWLNDYEVATTLGMDLIALRKEFLSAGKVRDAYLRYATQQFRRLSERGDGSFAADLRKRTAKHARHLMRLCHQGYLLYATGRLIIKLEDPEAFRVFGETVAGGDIEAARRLISIYEDKFDTTTTVLPERPDERAIETWLRAMRRVLLYKGIDVWGRDKETEFLG